MLFRISSPITSALALLLLACLPAWAAEEPSPAVFATPEQAVEAIAKLAEAHDDALITRVFGPGSVDMFRSGDAAADSEDIQRVTALIEEGVEFVQFDDNTLVAVLGDIGWPWPIPLARERSGWRFDTASGRDELLNRRIGRNELWTLAALHEIVEAQREYRQLNPQHAYAMRFRSSEGKRDGLYWPVEEGEALSPLGDLLAESEAVAPDPQPFHGYFYRLLTSRGDKAPGGARSYIDGQGRMSGGFAVVAWPAKYGNSGIMTFITNQRGLIFQKDLGADTGRLVEEIDSFNPDVSWAPTADSAFQAELQD